MRDVFILRTDEGACIGPFAVASIPKCGQHTLDKYAVCKVPESKLNNFPLRIAFIREPFDRWLSAYHFMCQSRYILEGERVREYNRFVDVALESEDDHVLPQSRFISSFGTLLPLHSMSKVIGALTGKEITKENASERHEIDTSYRKAEIMERYEDDTILYKSITEAE